MGRLVTIEPQKLTRIACYGVIVGQSPALTLPHYENDFQFDGYFVIRTKDITFAPSESNDYCERPIDWYALSEKVLPESLDVGGWSRACSPTSSASVTTQSEDYLYPSQRFVIVEVPQAEGQKLLAVASANVA